MPHAYDAIAEQYDEHWSRHVAAQHARLTRDLRLKPGDLLVDIAAGAGVTVEMLRVTAPAKGVAVDPSSAMLEKGRQRAEAEGLVLEGLQTTAQEFFATCEEASFDVLSLRFGLAYIDWEKDLPTLARPVRKGTGRIGLLSNLASSAPQALQTYHAFMDELGMEKAWPPVPRDTAQMAALLGQHDVEIVSQWTERVRIWFDTGALACAWLLQSGFITSAALDSFPPELMDMLMPVFAAKLEEDFAVEGRVPFDFDIGCVVGMRR
ncbi:MAG: methyltransferase domain-containing protein [Deltaproteobacteria bacterium]|nr:methyltransferase domain-containing protein [Deltaproteobacteria bacterium]